LDWPGSLEPFLFERAIAPGERFLQSALAHFLGELARAGSQA
jgi:hypothetical protein